MHFPTLLLVFFLASRSATASSLLDLLDWDVGGTEKRDNEENTRTCACNGPSCMCCVDFNLTYIDLGGPGCVHMKYLSQAEGIAVNVSYGESLLHSEQVKGPNPEPTCMSLLTNLAQICARFTELEPYEDGLRSCVALEPKLLETVTSRFSLGCFTMGPQGMKLQNSTYVSLLNGGLAQTNNVTQSEEDLNEEELLAAVSGTAEQGLAFLGNLFQITFGESNNNATAESEASASKPQQRSLHIKSSKVSTNANTVSP